MKFKVKKDVLIEKLQPVAKVINSRHTIPVLTGILVDVGYEEIHLTGSDTNQMVQVVITRDPEKPAFTVETPGKGVFPAKYFLELMKKLSGEEIEIEAEGLRIEIRSGRTNVHLQILSADDYPPAPFINESHIVNLKIGDLIKAFQKTKDFVGDGGTRPILQGVNVIITNDRIVYCATDSHRMSRYVHKWQCDEEVSQLSIVVPTKGLDVLSQFEENCDVKVVFDDKKIGIISDGMKFFSWLLEGMYPDTSRIVPQKYVAEYVLHREELAKAVDRALLFAKETKNNAVRLTFRGQEVTLKVDTEVGAVQEGVFAESYDGNDGEELTIGVNGRYLLEGLRVFDGSKIRVGLSGNVSPIVLSEPDNPNNIHLILPLRLG